MTLLYQHKFLIEQNIIISKDKNLNLIVLKYYDTRIAKRTIFTKRIVPFWLQNGIMGDVNVRWLDSMSRE